MMKPVDIVDKELCLLLPNDLSIPRNQKLCHKTVYSTLISTYFTILDRFMMLYIR